MRITYRDQGGYRTSLAGPMQICGHKWLEVGCNIAWMGKHWRLLLKKQLYPFQIPRLRLIYPNENLKLCILTWLFFHGSFPRPSFGS